MIALRLVRAHTGLFAALAATAAVAGALTVGVPGYLLGATTTATRDGVAELRGADGGFRVGVRLADDASAQDAAVRRVIARETAGAPIEVIRTLATSDAIDITVGDATRPAVLRSDPRLRDAASLVDGAWPTGPDQAAVQADAAERLGLDTGSRLEVGGRTLRVAALWRAENPPAPRWLGDRAIRTGRVDGADGPVVVAASLWSRLDVTPLVEWTIVPDASRTGPEDLDTLGRVDSSVPDALRASSLGDTGVQTEGGLADGMRAIALRITAVLATAPVSVIVLVALGLLALLELARLLLISRARETLLLRSRGASAARLAGASALEAGIVAGVSAVVGAGIAFLMVALATGVAAPPLLVASAVAGTTLISAAVFAISTGQAARSALTREQVADSGRRRRLASTGLVLLLGAAAVLSSIQFLRDGSPLIVQTGRIARVDPLAVPAPSLAIVAVALLAVAAAPLAARAGTALLDRGPRLGTLAARRLRRGLAAVASGIVLVAIATSLLVTASAYSATLDRAALENRALLLGADVVADGASTARLLDAADAVEGPSAPASVTTVDLGERSVTLVGIGARSIPAVATEAAGSVDRSALARALAVSAPGIPLDDDAGELRFTIDADPVAPERVTLRLLTRQGVVLDASGTPAEDGATSIAIPAGARRLVAVDAVLPPAGSLERDAPPLVTTFALEDPRTDAGPLDVGDGWGVPYVSPESSAPTLPYERLGATVGANPGVPTTVRLMAPGSRPLPVAVASDLAAASGLRRGSEVAMSDGTANVRIRVAAVVTAIPGAGGDGILADLPALRAAELRGTEPSDSLQLWAARGDGTVAERLRAALPGTATVSAVGDSATSGAISSATSGLRLGAAGALLLAAIAVAAVIGADLRARESDIAVLRALGADAARQGRDRALEHLAVLAYGAAAGALGGLAVSAVLVPGLARAAVPDLIPGLPIAVRVAPVDLLVGAGALAAGIAVLLVVTAARIRARARTAVVAEAVR